MSHTEDQKKEAILQLKDPCQGFTDPSTCTRRVGGGFPREFWGESWQGRTCKKPPSRLSFSANRLPGSVCKAGKHYSALLLITGVVKGFLGLGRQQIWQEASQALIQDIKIRGDGFELKLLGREGAGAGRNAKGNVLVGTAAASEAAGKICELRGEIFSLEGGEQAPSFSSSCWK